MSSVGVFVIKLNVVDPSLDVMPLGDVVELFVDITVLSSDTGEFSNDVVTLCEVDTFCGVIVWTSSAVVGRLMIVPSNTHW